MNTVRGKTKNLETRTFMRLVSTPEKVCLLRELPAAVTFLGLPLKAF